MSFRTRKESWEWKVPGCAELQWFDVAFSVKEYIQNQVGQVLKGLKVREWSDWLVEDLVDASLAERLEVKDKLLRDFPRMFLGPQHSTIKKKQWVPVYVLFAKIPEEKLLSGSEKTALEVCTVLWHHTRANLTGFTFYNNHLDQQARFDHFVLDGATTSRHSVAVGKMGKGFLLATQYLFEKIDHYLRHTDKADLPSDNKLGITFRVGHSVGELKWKKRAGKPTSQLPLVATEDDLEPLDIDEFVRRRSGLYLCFLSNGS